MLLGNLAGSNRNQTRQTRFRGKEVVVAPISLTAFDMVSDCEQLFFFVVEEFKFDFLDYLTR